jgi:hypothetical protein
MFLHQIKYMMLGAAIELFFFLEWVTALKWLRKIENPLIMR